MILLFTKLKLVKNPLAESVRVFIANQQKWTFNVFHSINRPLTNLRVKKFVLLYVQIITITKDSEEVTLCSTFLK